MLVRTFDERLNAAHMGRARHPLYIVVNFEDGYPSGVIVGNQAGFEYAVPRGGAKFDFPLYATMTGFGTYEISGNVFRNRRTADGYVIGSLFGYPQRLLFTMGDTRADTDRETPADWFYLPEPPIIHAGEFLRMRLVRSGYESSGDPGAGALPPASGGGGDLTVAGYKAVFLSEYIFKPNAEEGKLTESEIDEITEQINTRRQRTFIQFIDVDALDVNATYRMPELDEWCLIEGFVSGNANGGSANYLRYCEVGISDPNGVEWTNDSEKIPFLALASPIFDSNNKQETYRKLLTPYLVGPRREGLGFKFAQRAALGTDVGGKIGILMRTV